jgi:hypothetical protein
MNAKFERPWAGTLEAAFLQFPVTKSSSLAGQTRAKSGIYVHHCQHPNCQVAFTAIRLAPPCARTLTTREQGLRSNSTVIRDEVIILINMFLVPAPVRYCSGDYRAPNSLDHRSKAREARCADLTCAPSTSGSAIATGMLFLRIGAVSACEELPLWR